MPPYNDEKIIAGQGTIGLEILEDLPEVEAVFAPVGGGGLISGVAAAIKMTKPEVQIIGVEPELAANAQSSLRAGRIVQFPATKSPSPSPTACARKASATLISSTYSVSSTPSSPSAKTKSSKP